MSLHKVFCQPVTQHIIGNEVKPSGCTFHRNVKDRNAFFKKISQKYDADHEEARREGHYLPNEYTYLEPTPGLQPYYGFIDDATYRELQEKIRKGEAPHFPNIKAPTR